MRRVIFDIETGPLPDDKLEAVMPEFEAPSNWKDPEKIAACIAEKRAEWLGRAALSAITGRVLAIGMIGDGEVILCDDDEKTMLTSFWGIMASRASIDWVGFNIFGFDLPFLARRSWVHGVDLPGDLRIHGRYWHPRFIDLAEVWLMGDRQGYVSLDAVAKSLGHEGKSGNGADFARLLKEDPDKAKAYLSQDLRVTANVAKSILG